MSNRTAKKRLGAKAGDLRPPPPKLPEHLRAQQQEQERLQAAAAAEVERPARQLPAKPGKPAVLQQPPPPQPAEPVQPQRAAANPPPRARDAGVRAPE